METTTLRSAEIRLAEARAAMLSTPGDKSLRKAFETALETCIRSAHARNVNKARLLEAIDEEAGIIAALTRERMDGWKTTPEGR
jgi:hypothetical protein